MEDFRADLTEPKSSLVKAVHGPARKRGCETGIHSRSAGRDCHSLSGDEARKTLGRAACIPSWSAMLDEWSFEAPEKKGEHVTIDADYVRKMLTDIVKDQDLSRYIL